MTKKRKITFILNPKSGTQSKAEVPAMIHQTLEKELFDTEICFTEYRGHAAEIAKRKAEDGVDIVVAVGGDGTVNEVARSLVHTNTALAIIPCGSGNGLARHLCLPMDIKKAISIINSCQIEDFDYGVINGMPFFCTCGMGFDAFISEKFASAGKRGLGTYVENTLRGGLSYEPETYEIEMDGQTEHYRAFLIACGNASQYGNNFYIAPQASMSDGLLDVTIIETMNVLKAPQIVMQMINKTLDNNPNVKTFKCHSLHVRREQPGVIHYDGEPAEETAE